MQMSQMFPNVSPDKGLQSGGSEKASESSGEGFGALHNRILGEKGDSGKALLKADKLSLSEGDVLKDADGNAIGQIVKGEDGELSLQLEGGEGETISLDRLFSLFEDGGLDMLNQFLSGNSLQENFPELSGSDEGSTELVAMLDSLDDQQRQGVLTALTAFASDKVSAKGNGFEVTPGGGPSGNGNSLLSLLGVGGNGANNSNNGPQGLLQGLLGSELTASKGNDEQGALRFEGLKLAALDGAGGQDSGSRSSNAEAQNLLQQNGARAHEARESPLRQYTTSVQTPVQDQGKWGEQVASKIAWMAGKSIQAADIQLNPPDMGPIDVRVQVQNEQASITVHAQNNAVRDMLELNSNRLREMLQENGMDLAEFDVSGDAADTDTGESSQGQSDAEGSGPGLMVSQEGEKVATGELSVTVPDGVDTYA